MDSIQYSLLWNSSLWQNFFSLANEYRRSAPKWFLKMFFGANYIFQTVRSLGSCEFIFFLARARSSLAIAMPIFLRRWLLTTWNWTEKNITCETFRNAFYASFFSIWLRWFSWLSNRCHNFPHFETLKVSIFLLINFHFLMRLRLVWNIEIFSS